MKKQLKEMIINDGLKVYGDLVMVDGVLYPLPLVNGNEKIGKGVWHASTLATDKEISATVNGETITEKGTCPLTCPGCYGCTGNYRFNGVKYALIMRTRLLRNYPDIYFNLCRYQIAAEAIKYIRVHATGDFIENEARGWFEIFRDNSDLIGWTYTKCAIKGDIKKLNSLNNFNIVSSMVPGCGFNFGHISYILNAYNKLIAAGETPYICRCGIDKNQHCSNCTGCSKNKYVLFIEHSTDYKAESDPLYNDIKAIIEAQPAQLLQR